MPRAARADHPPVYKVLFTHIEDNTPAGTLSSTQSRQNYLFYRDRLISMATLARDSAVAWTLQPDWKFLEAALLYEDATLTQSTNGKNLLLHLKEDLGAVLDPHSHENGGYNYTDVAHLLDSLGVGGSTVIGGHVWDPSLPQFQEWDRFRAPVEGEHYTGAWWRGDVLMGSGTPNHVNDPVVSGVWRPRDRDHYFEHDPTANIVAIGQFRSAVDDVPELVGLYEDGVVPTELMLTSSYPVRPSVLTRTDGVESIRDSVIAPLLAMRREGMVVLTDFTSLIRTWETSFGSQGFIYDASHAADAGPAASTAPLAVERCVPNPVVTETVVRYTVSRPMRVRLAVFDVRSREVARLVDGMVAEGRHEVRWNAEGVASGLYFCRLDERREGGRGASASVVVVR